MSSRRTHFAGPVNKHFSTVSSTSFPPSDSLHDSPGHSFHTVSPLDELFDVNPFSAPVYSSAALDYASFLHQQPASQWNPITLPSSTSTARSRAAPPSSRVLPPDVAHGFRHHYVPAADLRVTQGHNRHKRRRPEQPSTNVRHRHHTRDAQFHNTSVWPFRSESHASCPQTSLPLLHTHNLRQSAVAPHQVRQSVPSSFLSVSSSPSVWTSALFPATSSSPGILKDNDDKYVREAAAIADRAKLTHRTTLKEAQRAREECAERNGILLSAKDKERERSRRESAVTRKRAEVYIAALERAARKLPPLEKEIRALRALLSMPRKESARRTEAHRVSPVSVEKVTGTPRRMEHIEL